MPYSLQVSPTEPFYEKKLEYDHKFLVDKKKKKTKKNRDWWKFLWKKSFVTSSFIGCFCPIKIYLVIYLFVFSLLCKVKTKNPARTSISSLFLNTVNCKPFGIYMFSVNMSNVWDLLKVDNENIRTTLDWDPCKSTKNQNS